MEGKVQARSGRVPQILWVRACPAGLTPGLIPSFRLWRAPPPARPDHHPARPVSTVCEAPARHVVAALNPWCVTLQLLARHIC